MKYTIEKLMEHPTYFHRVMGYVFRDSVFEDEFGITGEDFGPDNSLYIRLDQLKIRHPLITDSSRDKLGILGYVNNFELLRRMHKQRGIILKTNPTWEEVNSTPGEKGFDECGDDYTKIMLFLNFKEREDFYRKYTQYKIGLFGRNTSLPADERKVVVADIKKSSREYLDRLADDIYADVFSLMFNHYYDLQMRHVACVQADKEPKPKDEADLRNFTNLVEDNQDVLSSWQQSSGRGFIDNTKRYVRHSVGCQRRTQAGSASERRQNIMYRLPQMSSLNEGAGLCCMEDVLDIDYVPIFETFISGYRQDKIAASAEKEAAAALQGAN